jgi:hypothetical protein
MRYERGLRGASTKSRADRRPCVQHPPSSAVHLAARAPGAGWNATKDISATARRDQCGSGQAVVLT